MLERVINNLDQAENDGDMNEGGKTADPGIVAFPFKQFVLLRTDLFLITGIELFDLIDLRLELHHFDRVFLDHQRDREKNDLGDQREKDDRHAVILNKIIAKVHDPTERFAEYCIDNFQWIPSCCVFIISDLLYPEKSGAVLSNE